MTSRAELVRATTRRLAAAGLENAEREARLLVRAALHLSDLDLIARAEHAVDAGEAERVSAWTDRRLAGEPMARLSGRREFWSLDFALSPETLVPRPETETLVEAALEIYPDRATPLRVLDLGTGSGAILAALLMEWPNASGIGVDLSEGAARQARDNLARAPLGNRWAVMVGRWAEALDARFDLVVSNPPYIVSDEIDRLDIEVRVHDPLLALDGGPDGLIAYRAIADALPDLLAPGGHAILELGIGQQDAVAALLTARGLPPIGPAHRDLAGIARALVTRKP
ncbi:peptide chain release factor N(5)-glutamine methyltransferase [Ancylobacter pratisalsi]|uniref:Release factor glutamine methyltransferase n=1 Tax=Ancylobacter pratisalsi TaxID=1745854 RepID=A0A6P1YN55_9HYPH|nr:peptide chain release factor N(5)-glutamine methyltransferase [Ancylobacter pratisalsi]QIB33204.1 peptide chain release factor N(5)-glutamine methyltransferase [Ancylobacter pratisalsi]